ncbi:aspartic proteinase nepenthesin-1-like [Papaver somniferum]|uniref:aspartic proteinase nepenthesin-1-like n=1 Tax=Papaver somniferum TaxID=3469 RepID=UPI000E6FC120|nr:aspartic proteinase nepenthesin-1-like [Papaver somniferum]
MGIKIIFCILFMISLSHSVLSKADDKKPSGLTLKLIHRDSIESNNLTSIEKFRKIIHRSNLRANHLMSYSTDSASEPTYHQPSLYLESANYVVELNIGTPALSDRDQYLILDTAAELTWLQCDGCIDCFKQKLRLYNPRDSSTHKFLPCNHPLCKPYECNQNHCKFKEWDSPDVHVEGFMSTDCFVFEGVPVGGKYTVLDDVVFGCAYGTVGFGIEDDPRNNISGVFGLGPGPRSFSSQFSPQQRFAYCLADWHFGPPDYPGKLMFGDDALLPISGHVQVTPIVETDARSYFLKLADIQIYKKCLGFEQGKFDRAINGLGGFIIDSGTSISYFANDVYDRVRQEFVDYMKTLGLPEMDASSHHLDLCWHMPNGIPANLPSMVLYLQDNEYPEEPADCENQVGAQLIIDPMGLFHIEEKEDPHLCLGIMRSNGTDPTLNILGAKQQIDNKFSFDRKNKTLSWMTWDCASPLN